MFSFYFQQFWISGLSTPVKPYMVLVLVLGGAVVYLNPRFRLPPYVVFVAFFFVYMIFTSLYSKEFGTAIVRGAGIIMLVVAYFTLYLSSQSISPDLFERCIYKFTIVYSTAGLVYFAYGLYVYDPDPSQRKFFGLYFEGVLPRMRSFADSPNNLVLMMLPLFYTLYVSGLKKLKLAYAFIGVSVLLSLSITGYLCFMVPLLLTFFFGGKVRFLVMVLLVLVLSFAGFWFYESNDDFAEVVNHRLDRVSSGSGRLDLFVYSFEGISKSPVWGYGLGQARFYLEGFQGRDLQSTHNSFIEVFFEGGGVAMTFLLLSWLLLILYVLQKNRGIRRVKLLSYVLSLFIISFANMMVYVELMVLNFFVLGFLASQGNRGTSQIKVEPIATINPAII